MGKKFNDVEKWVGKKLSLCEKYIPLTQEQPTITIQYQCDILNTPLPGLPDHAFPVSHQSDLAP